MFADALKTNSVIPKGGVIPPIVMLMVWISTPDYISLLWTTHLGQFMLACCVGWMTIGVLVMKKMINFDF